MPGRMSLASAPASVRWELFGPRTADYDPDTYRPQPYSKSFVRNLPNWYAQAHPDEDFAETFAIWLDSWRPRVRKRLPPLSICLRELEAFPSR